MIRCFLAWTIARGTVEVFYRIFLRLRIAGRPRVPRTGALIFVANHESHFDPPLVGVSGRDRPTAFLARASLFKPRWFGSLIAFLGSIPLDPRGRGAAALKSAIDELEAGRCVTIFPEGTRSAPGSLGTFKSGVVFLVRRTGATVVPMGIGGAGACWPRTRRWPKLPGKVRVVIGTPIPAAEFEGLDDAGVLDLVRERILALRGEAEAWRAGGPHPTRGDGRAAAPPGGESPADASAARR